MRTCLFCSKDISHLSIKSKYCSTKCRVAFSRIHKAEKEVAPVVTIDEKLCSGCDGTDCRAGFVPNWKRAGFKSREQAVKSILEMLLDDQESIIGRGFSEELPITLGDTQVILRGKNPGRKKDK